MRQIFTSKAPKPLAKYSQAIVANNMVFIQGTLGIDPNTGKLVGETIEQQTEQIFKNIMAILEAANSSINKVVKVNVFLAKLSDYKRFNEIYELYFGEVPPVRTTVEAKLPLGALVEIDAIAIL